MWREIAADDRIEVDVDGFKVVAYSFGSGSETVFCLNGGPGLPCDYLRESHSCLVDQGYRVVAFDQLGTGASDRPTDASLWTIGRYVEETETVRKVLGLGKVHMLGHSWGGWLAIDYALTYQENLRTLILEDTVADMPHLVSELERLRASLGPETVSMMQKHEAQGTYSHPEYMAAVTILNYRHVCRLPDWPAPVRRSLDDWNMGPYETMQGPNEFLYIGNLKDWNRVSGSAEDQGAGADHPWRARRTDAGLRPAHEAWPAAGRAAHHPEREPHAFLREPGRVLSDPVRLPRAQQGRMMQAQSRWQTAGGETRHGHAPL